MQRVARILRIVLVAGLSVAVATVTGATCDAGWSTSVNILGDGIASVQLWGHPNVPPGFPNLVAGSTANSPSVSVPPPPVVGASPLTGVSAHAGAQWSTSAEGVAAHGDVIGGNPDLLSLVTPTSPVATISLDAKAQFMAANMLNFVITWTSSDAGTAQRLQWFSDVSRTTLLDSVTVVGPSSQTFSRSITTPTGDASTIIFDAAAIAVSAVPEPSSLSLFLLSAALPLGFGYVRRHGIRGRTIR